MIHILVSPLSADEVASDANEVDEFLSNEGFEVIDQIAQDEELFQKQKWKPPVIKEKRALLTPPTFTGYLKKGAILENIKDGKTVFIEKPIFIKAREVTIEGQYSYVFDKENNIRFRTHTSNITAIDKDLKLYPQVNPNIVYEEKQTFHSEEKTIPLDHSFSYEYENVSSKYYAQIFRGTKTSALATRVSWVGYLDTEFNFDFGINANLQVGSWNDEVIGKAAWNALFIGPIIRYSFLESPKASHNILFGIEKSLFHKSQKLPDQHNFSTLGILLGVNRVQSTFIGKVKYGITYRRFQSSIKNTTEYLEALTPRSTSTSIAFNLGYQWDINL
tara:strand:+ start:65086 stop:66081 length:996 start_codon:yes stop_codon:yes gene_type:complete